MDLQQLRYILALSEELNFNRAAKLVGISQPTLSQQIKKLEDELGEPLFERSPKAVRLTTAGERFLPYAKKALEELKAGVGEVQTKKAALSGTIKVAFIPTVGPYVLPRVIQALRKSAPDLTLKLYEETTSVLTANLKAGQFDLGLLALPIQDPSLVNKQLGSEEFFLAVSSKDPLAKQRSVSTQDVTDQRLLMLKEGHCFRDQALDFCRIPRHDTRLVFEGSSLMSVLNLVAAGEGVTLVPEMVVRGLANRHIKFVRFKKPRPYRNLGAIWRMTTPLNHACRHFLHVVETVLK